MPLHTKSFRYLERERFKIGKIAGNTSAKCTHIRAILQSLLAAKAMKKEDQIVHTYRIGILS